MRTAWLRPRSKGRLKCSTLRTSASNAFRSRSRTSRFMTLRLHLKLARASPDAVPEPDHVPLSVHPVVVYRVLPALNLPSASHRRSVTSATPRMLAASLILSSLGDPSYARR